MHPRWNCKNTFLKSSIFATRPKKSELLFAFDRLLTTSDERNGVSCKILEICFRWKFWIILEIWDLNDGRFWKYGICRYWKIYFTIFLRGGRWRTWGGLDQLGGDRQRLGSGWRQGFAGKWILAGCEDDHDQYDDDLIMIIDVHYNLQFFDSWPVLLSGCDIPSPPVCRASPCHRRQAGKFISAFENIMEHWIWSTFHLLENIIIPQTRRELQVWAWVLGLLSG